MPKDNISKDKLAPEYVMDVLRNPQDAVEPWSCYSSLVYLMPAVAAAAVAHEVLLTIAAVILAFTSAVYHATKEWLHRHLDVGLMFVTLALLPTAFDPAYYVVSVPIAGALSYMVYQSYNGNRVFSSTWVVGIMGVTVLALAFVHVPAGVVVIAGLFLLYGAVIRYFEPDDWGSSRVRWDLMHSFWHVLTATGLTLLILGGSA